MWPCATVRGLDRRRPGELADSFAVTMRLELAGTTGREALLPLTAKEHPVAHPEPVLVSVETARAMLGIGKTTIFAAIKAGDLETIKWGRRRLVRVSSIRALADRAVAA